MYVRHLRVVFQGADLNLVPRTFPFDNWGRPPQFSKGKALGTRLGGSRGRVQGVRTLPPEIKPSLRLRFWNLFSSSSPVIYAILGGATPKPKNNPGSTLFLLFPAEISMPHINSVMQMRKVEREKRVFLSFHKLSAGKRKHASTKFTESSETGGNLDSLNSCEIAKSEFPVPHPHDLCTR